MFVKYFPIPIIKILSQLSLSLSFQMDHFVVTCIFTDKNGYSLKANIHEEIVPIYSSPLNNNRYVRVELLEYLFHIR